MISKRELQKLINNDKNSLDRLYRKKKKWYDFINDYIKNKPLDITNDKLLLIKNYIDERIINDLENGNTDALTKIKDLYEKYFVNTIKKEFYNFTIDEIKDLFTDSYMDLYENICRKKLTQKSKLITYLVTIGKNKGYNIIRKKKIQKKYNPIIIDDPIIYPDSDMSKEDLKNQICNLKFKHRKILELFYYKNMSYNSIKWTMEKKYNIKFSSLASIRVIKSNCIKKLKEIL